MPIKINDIKKQNNINTVSQRENSKPIKSTDNGFAQRLSNLTGDSLKEKVNSLLMEIESQSKKIEKNYQLSEILRYKKLVKEFLNLTVTNSHKFSKNNFLDRRGRHRVMTLVKQVDEELEKMTQDFLKTEDGSLKVLKRLDGIRGLLLDIFL